MQLRAIIFDFNGTLFDDTDFHNQAWTKFSLQHGRELSSEDIKLHIHGFTNREIFRYVLDRPIHKNEEEELDEEKETLYRNFCTNYPEKCILTPGAIEFLDILKKKKIPRTIATASYLKNVKLYFSLFNLSRWFNLDDVIYDSGAYRGKPYPDMYLAAAKKINIPIENCMVIEDSVGGLKAAQNADAGRIIAISTGKDTEKFSQLNFIDQIISDFRQIVFN
jgi:beta-phosphoglucomutase